MGPSSDGSGDYTTDRVPEIVGNVRYDAPWGALQIMAARHDATGGCYGNNVACPLGSPPRTAGYAFGGGFMARLPSAPGDTVWIQITKATGASSYLGFNRFMGNSLIAMYDGGAPINLGGNGNVGLGWAFDGIFQTGTAVSLTKGWQISGAAEHYWTPEWRTSGFAGMSWLEFGTGNLSPTSRFCTGLATNPPGPNQVGSSPLSTCDPSFTIYQYGTRTVWAPLRNFEIGVEVVRTVYDQNMIGAWNLGVSGARPAGLYTAKDQKITSAIVRAQWTFCDGLSLTQKCDSKL